MDLLPSTPEPFHSWTLLLATVAICATSTFFLAVIIWFNRRDHHVQAIPGPVDSASWLYGNLPELLLSQPYGKYEFQWQEQYGSTYRVKGRFNKDLLLTSDPTTIRRILNNDELFISPPQRVFAATMILGKDSMLALQHGESHRRIKNAFATAFTMSRLQPYVLAIRNVARKATDKLMQKYLENKESDSSLDIYQLLQHVTSDIIGHVGFGYDFNAVETDGGDKVSQSHLNIAVLIATRSKISILGDGVMPYIPHLLFKFMLNLPIQTFSTILRFHTISDAWARALLNKSLHASDSNDRDTGLVGLVASTNKNKKRERLSFNEICRQTPTLLVAGQETSANAISWALYELAKRPAWQDKIRAEINETHDVDSRLDKLKYLNALIKEILRFHATGPLADRMASEDTILPLSQPITTPLGPISEVPIRKGQIIYYAVAAYNRNPHVWGSDANLFEPSRWLDGRYNSENLPGSIGPYSNLATFGGGAHTCLGWRLSVLEMQVVLSELLSRFQFSFNPGQENDVISCFATTLLPINAKTGKPGLEIVVRPVQSSRSSK